LKNLAKDKEFNPLEAKNWYSISSQDIADAGGNSILAYYGHSYSRALIELFPEIQFKKSEFRKFRAPDEYKNLASLRKFFDDFSHFQKFDPLDIGKWNFITTREIIAAGGRRVLTKHHSLHRALMLAYPELMSQKEKLAFRGDRTDPARRRKFFDDFAKTRQFNPLHTEKWYFITLQDILQAKGGFRVLKYYDMSHCKALIELYPELSFQKQTW